MTNKECTMSYELVPKSQPFGRGRLIVQLGKRFYHYQIRGEQNVREDTMLTAIKAANCALRTSKKPLRRLEISVED